MHSNHRNAANTALYTNIGQKSVWPGKGMIDREELHRHQIITSICIGKNSPLYNEVIIMF